MRTFWAHGFEATTLDRLEKATGLQRQSLYNSFGDKAAMFDAALARYREQVGAPLQALVKHEEPAVALRDYLEGHATMLSDPGTPGGCLIASCSSELGQRDDPLGLRMRQETAAATVAFREMFAAWQTQGKLTPGADPGRLAALLAAVVRGLAVLGRSTPDPQLLREAVAGAIDAFAPFLRKAHSGSGRSARSTPTNAR